MSTQTFTILTLLVVLSQAIYPELKLCTSIQVLNDEIGDNLGPLIQQQLKNFTVPGPIFQKVDTPIKANATLTDIKIINTDIRWNTNVLIPNSQYNFTVKARKVSLAMSTFLVGHVSLKKINTTVTLSISQMDLDLNMQILPNQSPSGIGFTLNISHVELDEKAIQIKFQNDTIDSTVAGLVIWIIRNSLNSIINTIVAKQINPMIRELTNQHAFEDLVLNNNVYSIDIKTTDLPGFVNKTYFQLSLDINMTNVNTGAHNPDKQSDSLPDKVYPQVNDLEFVVSSGLVDSLIWLAGDSQVIDIFINNETLGDAAPVTLDTSGLSILIPDLPAKYGVGRGMYLHIATNKLSPEVLIRNGRVVGSFPVDVQFVVDLTNSYPTKDVKKCLQNRYCKSAATINTTALFSAALKTDTRNILFASLQTIKIYSMQKYEPSQVRVNTDMLKKVLNNLILSLVPPVNSELVAGMPIPMELLKGLNVTKIQLQTNLDYLAAGALLDFS